jgi:hypothetical protein
MLIALQHLWLQQINAPQQPNLASWQQVVQQVDWESVTGQSFAQLALWQQTLYTAFLADRVGYAFVAGYLSAIRRLAPTIPADQWGVLCVTEQGGNHPRAIQTTLTPQADGSYRLKGAKAFVTLAHEAQVLLIAASSGQNAAGHNQLQIVQLPRSTANLHIEVLPALPFVPEISHGTVTLADVRVTPDQILAGDGYSEYVKRFRTLEDIYVFTGLVAHLYCVACRSAWSTALREQMLSILTQLNLLSQQSPDSIETHILLGGVMQQFQQVLGLLDWSKVESATRERWQRDQALLKVAQDARVRRLQAAWFALEQGG